MSVARGGTSVMARRKEPPSSLDYFPTPPWATRAGAEVILSLDPTARQACEPACGEGHMAAVLHESFPSVHAFDVFPYGYGEQRDFLDEAAWQDSTFEWVISNPPFKIAEQFVTLSLERSTRGVAMLLRSAFAEGGDRYRQLFKDHPPAVIAQYVERVAMVAGRWDPKASSATAYAWFIWVKGTVGSTEFRWIPPGTKSRLTRPDDATRFSELAAIPLFPEAAE